ncbi:hypothetical protein VQ056_11705 [Paenibacillus sp. JTLBN-2024]
MKGMFKELRSNGWYYLMALPGLLYFLVFCYLPLPGILIAFKDYNFKDGIFGSPWAGLQNFAFYFHGDYAWRTTFNTLFINANYIVFRHGDRCRLCDFAERDPQKLFAEQYKA